MKTPNTTSKIKLNLKITAFVVIVFGVIIATIILLWSQNSKKELTQPIPESEPQQLAGLSPGAREAFERAMAFENLPYVSEDFDPSNGEGYIAFIYDFDSRFQIHYLAHENRFRIVLTAIKDEEDFNNVLKVAEDYFLSDILKTNNKEVACEFDVLITAMPPDPSSMPKPVPSRASLTFCDNNTSSGAVNNDSGGSIEAANNSIDRIFELFPGLFSVAYAHLATPVAKRPDCHWGFLNNGVSVEWGYTYCGCSSFLGTYFGTYSWVAREAAAQEADCNAAARSGSYATAFCTLGEDMGLFQIRAGGNCGHCGESRTCARTEVTVNLSPDLATCKGQLLNAANNANFACGMTGGGTNWTGFYAVLYCVPEYPSPPPSYFQKF